MKGFVQHEACPRCNSRDNLARYSDGSGWCFGCHYFEKATLSPYVMQDLDSRRKQSEAPSDGRVGLPDDISTNFSEDAVRWLGTYSLDIPTAIQRGVVFSPSRNQIIYQLGNVWQARNLRANARSKNFTSGNVNECTHIYGSSNDLHPNGSDALVIVEDPVSAIRVAALQDALPLLGSYLATSRLNAVTGLYKALVVWLDSDKLKEARDIARRAELIGVNTRVVWTELDPKCYTDEQIKEILNA